MKRLVISLLLCAVVLGAVGCVNDDPIADQWTHNLYPDSNGSYVIGSNGSPYTEGHFTNIFANMLYITGSIINGATTNLSYGGATLRLDGSFAPASMSNASAMNNSIYFSTDSNVLTYKDSVGVTHDLY